MGDLDAADGAAGFVGVHVDAIVVITASDHDVGIVLLGLLEDHPERSPDEPSAPLHRQSVDGVVLQCNQMPHPRLDDGIGYEGVGPSRRRRAASWAEREHVHVQVSDTLGDVDGSEEVGFGFAGKAADDVGGDGRRKSGVVCEGLVDRIDHVQVVAHSILTIHVP